MIEVLIASVIGTLLVAILLQLYFSMQNAYQQIRYLNHAQQNAMSATYYLQQALEKSGHIGCAKLAANFNMHGEINKLNAGNMFIGDDHQISVRYMGYPKVKLSESMRNDKNLIVSGDEIIQKGEVMVIANCRQADIFTVANVRQRGDQQIITTTQALSVKYDTQAEIGQLVEERFLIEKTKYQHQDGSDLLALFVERNGNDIRLVDDIEGMDFVYWVRDQTGVKKCQASEIQEWTKVVGVSAELTMYKNKKWYFTGSRGQATG